jgi:phosphatidate cytidylyltransferase
LRALGELPRSNLTLRVISAVVLFPVAVAVTVIGGTPFALLAGGAAALAALELVRMFGPLGAVETLGVLVAGALPIAAATAPQGALLPEWTFLLLAGATVALLAALLFRKAPLEALPRAAAVVVLSWAYCGLLLACAVGLRRFGVGWVILAFVVTWANDTFAYFAGRAFGRHKLFERISPKKTWEGFAGGAVGSIVGALVTRWLLPHEADAGTVDLESLSLAATVLIGAGGAVLGPLGDLCESMFKRAAGVKDSGWIIPGHGGLLDRIDALLFVAPWVYLWAAHGVG